MIRHTTIPRDFTLWNPVPHLAEARGMAELFGEPIAIYRYADQYPDDVFIKPLADVKRDDRLVVEVVINPLCTP